MELKVISVCSTINLTVNEKVYFEVTDNLGNVKKYVLSPKGNGLIVPDRIRFKGDINE